MRTYGKLLAAALALSALPLLYACDDPVTPQPLTVSPVFAKVYVGQMVQLQATFNGSNVRLTGEIEWSSTDAAVAEVDHDGWVKGLKPGNATIAAGCANYCGTARVRVVPDPGSDEEGPPGGAR